MNTKKKRIQTTENKTVSDIYISVVIENMTALSIDTVIVTEKETEYSIGTTTMTKKKIDGIKQLHYSRDGEQKCIKQSYHSPD